MIRNLKALGLATVATLAMSAVVTSGAQALEFTADNPADYPVTLHGVQVEGETHVFTTAGGREITCEIATFAGTLEEASTAVTLVPIYEDCHAIVLGSELEVTVTKSDPCGLKVTATPIVTTDSTEHHGSPQVHQQCTFTIDIYANAHDHLVTNKTLCQLHIAPQNSLGSISFANHEEAGDITVNANISGIATTRTGSASCGASGNATYLGNTIVSGKNEVGEPVDVHVK